MKVYLYIKVHNVTGLKYFGRTVQEPFAYKGSGKYWRNHLKAHGNDVTTTIFGTYEDSDPQLKTIALEFSKVNEIVNSEDWANYIEEDGQHSGGALFKGHKHTEENRKAFAKQLTEVGQGTRFKKGQQAHNLGVEHNDNTKAKMKEAWKTRPADKPEVRAKKTKALTDYAGRWVNDGIKAKYVKGTDVETYLAKGYVFGRKIK